MPKHSIRENMLATRKHMAAATCLSTSLRAQERLVLTDSFRAARTIGLYSPVMNEVFTEMIFEVACRDNKVVVYPRVLGGDLQFVHVQNKHEMGKGAFGILEPTGQDICPASAVDFFIIPGVAFDVSGHRLGYGKGFYDRALHGLPDRGVLAGLCFDFQLLPQLPVEEHDVQMDLIVTERRAIDTGKRSAVRHSFT